MKRIKYFFILAILLFSISEALTRICIPEKRADLGLDRSSDHPYIRKNWVPGFKTDYQVGIPGQPDPVPFEINEFGFRSGSMKTREKPPETSRVFFLGESTTESVTLPEEKTFPFLVESALNSAKAPARFQCINAAMSGNLAADSLVTLIYKVMYYQPDIIVVMHAINDLRYGAVPTFDPIKRSDFDRSFYFGGFSEKGGALSWFRSVCRKSYLLTFLKRLAVKGSGPSIQSKWQSMVAKRQHTPVSVVQESKALGDFLKNLKEMIFIARGHKIRLILMTEPCIYQENISTEINDKLWMGCLPKPGINLSNEFLNREMRRFNDAILGLQNEYGAEVIDLEKEIPKTLDYFYDDVHLTARGAAKAGQVIADYLLNAPKRPVSQVS